MIGPVVVRFGVRHEAEYPARGVADTGDVPHGTVGVVRVFPSRRGSVRPRVAHYDLPAPIEAVPAELPGPDRQLFSRELRARIQAVMARMSDLERSAFVLRHFEGQSTEEIARTLGLDGSAVKQGVFRAVRKLRVALEAVRPEASLQQAEGSR